MQRNEKDYAMERDHPARHQDVHHYAVFALNMALSLLAMYLVMFSMIDSWGDFRNNLNMLYMAITMICPHGHRHARDHGRDVC